MRGIRWCFNHVIVRVAAVVGTYSCTRRVVLLLLLALSIFTTTTVSMSNSSRLAKEHILSLRLADIQNKMEYLVSSYRAKQEEINNLQMLLENVTNGNRQPCRAPNNTVSQEIASLLKTINDSNLGAAMITKKIQSMPYVSQLLPHHLDKPRSLYPGFHMKGSKIFSDFVFGIPTVRRLKDSYLLITLKNLIAGLKNKYEDSTLIIICVGETDLKYVINVAQQVTAKFPEQVKSGLIEVISPSPEFYPDFQNDKSNLGDTDLHFRWRTKQNLDAIFLMTYAQTKGTYYLMLEDDIITVPDYMDAIKNFTSEMSVENPYWLFIEYCNIGGIGKLFKTEVLRHFVIYLELFYNHMPIDWLLEKFIENRECAIGNNVTQCAKIKLQFRPRYKNNLFEHIGKFSSFKGKTHHIRAGTRWRSKYGADLKTAITSQFRPKQDNRTLTWS